MVAESFTRFAEGPDAASSATLALKCWKDIVCETGTAATLTVAYADGFGENVWRQVTAMEFIQQALTYPEIGKIIYTSARGDAVQGDLRPARLIAQGVDVIVVFADAGEALLPTIKEATEAGIRSSCTTAPMSAARPARTT